jgi:hypothetical protein
MIKRITAQPVQLIVEPISGKTHFDHTCSLVTHHLSKLGSFGGQFKPFAC